MEWHTKIHVVDVLSITESIQSSLNRYLSFCDVEQKKQCCKESLELPIGFYKELFMLYDSFDTKQDCVHRACCKGLCSTMIPRSANTVEKKIKKRKRETKGSTNTGSIKGKKLQTIFCKMHFSPFLQVETWLRHDLSLQEVTETMNAFNVQDLWNLATFHNIKISNSAIKRSEESTTSLIFSCKSLVISKLKKILSELIDKEKNTFPLLHSFSLSKNVSEGHKSSLPAPSTPVESPRTKDSSNDVKNRPVSCCAYSVLHYFSHQLHSPFCPTHKLNNKKDLSLLASALDGRSSVNFLEKSTQFAHQGSSSPPENPLSLRKVASDEKKNNTGSGLCCDSINCLISGAPISSPYKCTKTPLPPSFVVEVDSEPLEVPRYVRVDSFLHQQSVAMEAMESMWQLVFATWNTVLVKNVFFWRGIFFSTMCVRDNFVRCCRVVPLVHFVESQVCKERSYPCRPHLEMPTLVCVPLQKKNEKMWWVALEETFYFFV